MIGKLDASGRFEVVWRSISPIKASAWSRYLPDSAKRVADWTFPWVCGGCTEPTFKIGDIVLFAWREPQHTGAGAEMITIPQLTAQALGSFLARETEGRFRSSDSD
jgi:hypothetical protein